MSDSTPTKYWRNRIIKVTDLPASDFLANPDNWRVHPLEQQATMSDVLSEVGWVQDVIVNLRTSPEWGSNQNIETLIDGHMRVALALRQDETMLVPVKYVDLSPAVEALILATFDPLGQMAGQDAEKLAELLSTIDADGDAVNALLDGMTDAAMADKLPVQEQTLRPRTMLRILISVPVDEALQVQKAVESIAALPGVEVDYGTN